jgi:DMSO/TMAO reductase YedYZ molybdopterin-dependent catalytic subunit
VGYWDMDELDQRQREHCQSTRRYFVQLGCAAAAAWSASPLAVAYADADPQLREAIAKLEYLTPPDRTWTVLDKAKAGVAKLPPERLREIGLAPETWSLDVIPDPASDSKVEQSLSRALGNALDWNGLMKLSEKNAVRFLHVCTCTNGADPYHMDLWEGVPFRDVIWITKPKESVRRVYYQSYHPDNLPPFQSSLPLSQVLETPPGLAPVILAYKRNGRPIPALQGGPVRMIVPGSYGNKSIKWVQRAVLTNNYQANDSDAADFNNDTENQLKTRARFINVPKEIPPRKPAALTGMAQVGVSGLEKVQYFVHSQEHPWPEDDPNWTRADWKDAAILPPPSDWGGGLPGGKLPPNTSQIDPAKGTPLQWPMRYTLVHWAALLPGLPTGSYDLCCRTIDGNGIAQPMPRPFPRTGFNAIHRVTLAVKA